jgi:glycosyltransferase involved in cell wall biosynthesis
MSAQPRVAIVSDPLVQHGGAERCVEVMARTFPDAPIFALLYSPVSGPPSLESRVITSPLQRIPGATRRHRWLLPLYPGGIESFDLTGYDVILSSHHTVAKGLLRGADQVHLCYCHTPMRALWERPFAELRSVSPLVRPFAAETMRRLRIWDYVTAARVDVFLANSRTTQSRIAKHYRRESIVVNPPIDIDRFTPGNDAGEGDYYLVVSRLVPYKRVDLAIAATAALGRRLVIAGGGPDQRVLAGAAHVDYRGHISDEELLHLMRGARAMIFPANEDFGMAPVEMMACGKPVVAYGAGGAAETVIDGVTGVFAEQQTVAAFVDALERFERTTFDRARIRAHAESYSERRFQATLRAHVDAAFESLGKPPSRAEPVIAKPIRLQTPLPAAPRPRVLHVLEATLGGTRRFLSDLIPLEVGVESGIVYATLRADSAWPEVLESAWRHDWPVWKVEMTRHIAPFSDFRAVLRIQSILRTWKPDVVHAHSAKAGGVVRLAALGLLRPPKIIYSPHALPMHLGAIYRLLERGLSGATTRYMAVSDSERDEITSCGLAEKARVDVVYPMVDTKHYAPRDKQAARHALQLSSSAPLLLAVGRLSEQKDPLAFFRIAAAVRRQFPHLRAIWVGDGELRASVQAAVDRIDGGAWATIAGWVHDPRDYLAAADVVMSTARYESFGYVVAEAFSMRRPVIASNVMGTVDIMSVPELQRCLYPVNDEARATALTVALLEDAHEAARVAAVGRRHITRCFSADSMRDSLGGAYQRVLGRTAAELQLS